MVNRVIQYKVPTHVNCEPNLCYLFMENIHSSITDRTDHKTVKHP